LLFAAEVEILNELDAPGRDAALVEAAEAYRARAATFQAMGKTKPAYNDRARAARLEARAAKLKKGTGKAAGPAISSESLAGKPDTSLRAKMGRIRIVNAWKEPVTVVLEGTSYYLLAGEERELTRQAGYFTYEVQMVQHWAKAKVEAGQTYTIRIRSR
jgi:hypothetical protein